MAISSTHSPQAARRKTLSRAARDVIRGMRVHQWLKNLLILVPAATAHCLLERDTFALLILAFFSFSVCASAGYLFNDLLDLKSDRQHHNNRHRPLASGALSPLFGASVAGALFLTGIGFGSAVSRLYLICLCAYSVLTVAYSVRLKTVPLFDIFLLALFYTGRVLIGGVAAGVVVSFWLAAFSMFFFFSLALVKRFNEVRLVLKGGGSGVVRRDYGAEDLAMLAMWGAAAGCASIVVLALYINSDDVKRLYRHPSFLWPVCLLLLYWLNRIWMLANRDGLPYDPIVFATRDWQSYVVAGLVAGSVIWAV